MSTTEWKPYVVSFETASGKQVAIDVLLARDEEGAVRNAKDRTRKFTSKVKSRLHAEVKEICVE